MKHLIAVAPVHKVHGRPILFGDGIKVPKEGRRMPGVKLVHQESECNSKKEFVFAHFFDGVALAVSGLEAVVALPIRLALHDGFIAHKKGKHASTLVERMGSTMVTLASACPAYFCLDAYYACYYLMALAQHHGHHLISRVRKNVVAFRKPEPRTPGKRGRPRKYGEKVALAELFNQPEQFVKVVVKHEGKVLEQLCRIEDLLWRGFLVRFVLVINAKGERFILISTDTSLSSEEILGIYLLRFQIELSFRWLVQIVHAFTYRFWMKAFPKGQREEGDFNMVTVNKKMREAVGRKVRAYESYVMVAVIALGSLQLLALTHAREVWKAFPLWFRTLPGEDRMPSALVVKYTLQQDVSRILANNPETLLIGKILKELPRTEEPDHPMKYAMNAA
jgi:hypothetical protein